MGESRSRRCTIELARLLSMHSIFGRLGFVFICTFALLASAGCTNQPGATSGGKKRIVFLTNGSDPFWDACRSGLEEGARQLDIDKAGYTVAMEVNNGKPQGQIDKLRQFASQGDVAAVAISV